MTRFEAKPIDPAIEVMANELASEASAAMKPTLDKMKAYGLLLNDEERDALYDMFWEGVA